MLMSPLKLIMLRLWCLTIGRSALGMKALRWFLVRLLITSKKGNQRYTASSCFFTPSELSGAKASEKTEKV